MEQAKTDNSSERNTLLEYNVTPPVLPNGFTIRELNYQGDLREDTLIPRKMPSTSMQ